MKSQEDVIEKYLRNELTQIEVGEFEKALIEDKDLRGRLMQEASLYSAFDESRHQKIKSRLQDLEQKAGDARNMPTSSTSDSTTHSLEPAWNRVWRWAAVVLLVAAAGYFLLDQSPKSSGQLYAENYTVYPNVVDPLKRGDQTGAETDPRTNFFRFYEAGQYSTAYEAAQLVPELATDLDLQFYLGLCEVEIGLSESALNRFEAVSASVSDLKYPAIWYKALTYLQLENPEGAVVELRKLKGSGSSYESKAEKLLGDLE